MSTTNTQSLINYNFRQGEVKQFRTQLQTIFEYLVEPINIILGYGIK